ncbi:MAG: hypothetical protein DIU79_05105 [Actinobacteria bacterium]|nr:MAG: hypothetical protein DIU79_05105 [Actinomycetota bacterium]
MWNRLSNGLYASDAYIKRSSTPPRCTTSGSTPAYTGTVHTNGALLNLRAGTTTTSAIRGTLRDGSTVTIVCQQPGQQIKGDVRTTNMWNRLSNGLYASDAYIKRSSTPPRCTEPVATTQPSPSASSLTGKVNTGGVLLNVRFGPTTYSPVVNTLKDGSTITIVCQQAGQEISGVVRKTKMWNKLSNGSFVSDAYVVRSGTPPSCPPLPPELQGWVAPVDAPGGSAFRTKERPTHDGIDFPTYKNKPIYAVADGRVIVVECNASTNNCDVDGSPQVYGCGWYVEIEHANRIVTRYCHMIRRPPVKVGQWVKAGEVIGHVGSSGNSSGPHLHFEVHVNAPPATRATAVDPRAFMAERGVYF